MKKIFLPLLALFVIDMAEARDTLAILPFTGGQGEEGETIAELFSYTDIKRMFKLVPRTSIKEAINREQRFQRESGMTDPANVAALGREVGAQYVLSGKMTRLGEQNLLLISILKIDDLRQIAGDIQTYARIEEIQGRLPEMAKNVIAAARKKNSRLPPLAVVPVQLEDGADSQVADLLAQLLAIHIIRSGKYAVYPRTSSLEQVRIEYRTQRDSKATAENQAAKPGKGANPNRVLSVTARKLGGGTMFNAAVINLVTGIQEAGESVNYQNLNDGRGVMQTLAEKLTGIARQQAFFSNDARFFSLGASVGSSFTAPWALASVSGTASIFPHTFFDAGCDFGLIHGYEGYGNVRYYSLYPFAHLNGFAHVTLADWSAAWYAGAGGGYMMAYYEGNGEDNEYTIPVLDVTSGIYFGKDHHYLSLAWALRTNFEAVNHKVTAGYRYRF
ncbi:MAG: penicillin-binding protein activator LpoB [Treponema sp.]|jgi:hypothetical protein|nr:penicillin-binding protein activator LpoB [Treponema sp.]